MKKAEENIGRPTTDRRLCLITVAAIVGLSLAGCGGGDNATPAGGLTKIRASQAPYFNYAPYFIAQDEGFFADEGLEVEFVDLLQSSQVLAALVNGEIDVASHTPDPGLFNMIARGARIRIVAGRGYVGDGPPAACAILARKALADDGVLTDPARLRGLRLVTTERNAYAFLYEKALASRGLTVDDFDLRVVPVPARPALLKNGGLDLVSAGEPWVTRLLETGTVVRWIADYEVAAAFQLSYVAFGPSLLGGNPEAGRAFMRAYLRGVRQYNEGKTERNIEIIARHTRLDPAFLRRLGWTLIRQDGRLNVESVQEYQAWAEGKGLIDRLLKPEEFYDPSFAADAAAAIKAHSRGT